ncbi:hypothetical protein GW17_00001729, partial [Ensete ventricosum]
MFGSWCREDDSRWDAQGVVVVITITTVILLRALLTIIIGKLAGNVKGDRREEDRRTCRKNAGGDWISG